MKSVVVVIALIVGTQSSILKELDNEDWTYFKTKFDKTYRTLEEEIYRYNIYKDTKAQVVKHNKQHEMGLRTYKMGINRFSDMSSTEMEAMKGYKMSNQLKCNSKINAHINTGKKLPGSVDWRTKNAVTPAKNQMKCGSCWAFSATGAMEGQTAIKYGKLVSLSEQNLVDCDTASQGCGGGTMTAAFEYVKNNNGIDTEESYIYKAVAQQCAFNISNVGAKITGYKEITSGKEEDLADAIANVGPIAVAVDASGLYYYEAGIFDAQYCHEDELDHGVLVVGYGTEKGEGYWIVKNSWGEDWGENGFYRLRKDRTNVCGIASMASYPTM